MNCRQVRELKESYVDEQLSGTQRLGFESHLASCPHCAARVTLAQRIHQELGPALHQAMGDPRLSLAAEARIRAQLRESVAPESQPGWLRWGTWVAAPVLALGAALLLTLVIGLLLTSRLPATQQAFITPPARDTAVSGSTALAILATQTPSPKTTPAPVRPTQTSLPMDTPVSTSTPAEPAITQTQPSAPAPTQSIAAVQTPQPTPSPASPRPAPTGVPVTPSAIVTGVFTPTANDAWRHYLEGESVTCVIRHGPEIWAGTASGDLVRLDTRNGEQTRIAPGEGVQAPITSLAVDARGQVWAATSGQGVFVLGAVEPDDPSSRTVAAVNAGLSSKDVYALTVDAAGGVWCGTADGFVNRLVSESTGQGRAWQSFAVPNARPGTRVTALAADVAGTLWVGVRGHQVAETATYEGGGLYLLRAGETPTWEKALSDDVGVVEAILVRPDGKWVATSPTGEEGNPRARGGGVVAWDGKTWTLFEALGAGMPSRQVVDVAVDARTRTWVATGNGLVVYEGTQHTVYRASNSGLTSDNVQAIALDGGDGVWVATNAGLCHLPVQ